MPITPKLFGVFVLSMWLLLPSLAFGQAKVAILGYQNVGQDASATYLASSLTEATQKNIRKDYSFQELAEKDWKYIAEVNSIFLEDLYTRTAAMRLGSLCQQDFVITGSYTTKRIADRVQLQTTTYVISVRNQTVVRTLNFTTSIDSNLFTAVGEVSRRVSESLSTLLPKRGSTESFLDLNRKSILAGLQFGHYFGFGDRSSATLSGNEKMDMRSFPSQWQIDAEAGHRDLVMRNWGLGLFLAMALGAEDFKAAGNTEKVNGNSLTFKTGLSTFYMWQLDKMVWLKPEIRFGLAWNQLELDYSNLRNQAVDSNGRTISSSSYSTNQVYLDYGLAGIHPINTTIQITAALRHQMYFYEDALAHGLSFSIGSSAGF